MARHLLVAAPLLLTILVESYRERTASLAAAIAAVVGGIALAILLFAAAEWFRVVFATRGGGPGEPDSAPEPDLLFPTRAPGVGPLFEQAPRYDPARTVREGTMRRLREAPSSVLEGYVEGGRLLPGHLLSTIVFLFFLVVYFAVCLWGWPENRAGTRIPALAFLLILLITATWPLAGLAFFLDRFRVPTLTVVAVWLGLAWILPTSDHVFVTHPAPAARVPLSPADVLGRSGHPVVAVVAASGGGIRAAGWAARVLTGIQETSPDFIESVRFVSAVSGGSVGAMHFVDRCERGPGRCDARGLAAIVERAMASSLNEIGWGFAYPDFGRAVFPFVGRLERDRAWAMERAWARHLDGPDTRLSEWRRRVDAGAAPAIAFNVTVVETGQRLVIPTADVPGAVAFDTLYAGRDVSVLTAVRLSATFPFVTPVARAQRSNGADLPMVHLADGGYVDNGGIGTAAEWLAVVREADRAPPVALIEIDAVVSEKPGKDRGWPYQLVAPIDGLLAIRTQAPRDRNEFALRLLQGGPSPGLQRFCFRYEGDGIRCRGISARNSSAWCGMRGWRRGTRTSWRGSSSSWPPVARASRSRRSAPEGKRPCSAVRSPGGVGVGARAFTAIAAVLALAEQPVPQLALAARSRSATIPSAACDRAGGFPSKHFLHPGCV